MLSIETVEQTEEMMILIADDNPLMRKMLRSLVEDLDPAIVECADGAAALSLYAEHRPEWVLMDISMQPVDGLTATREIIEKFPAARIVIVTGHDDPDTRATALEAGAREFLGKSDLLPLRSLISEKPP
jgi:DNA-binding NarL/FixJ family response regulator